MNSDKVKTAKSVFFHSERSLAPLIFSTGFYKQRRLGILGYMEVSLSVITLPFRLIMGAITLLLVFAFRNLFRGESAIGVGVLRSSFFMYNPISLGLRILRKLTDLSDNRPKVLYLKSFAMDSRDAPFPVNGKIPIEPIVALQMKRFGRFIALGERLVAQRGAMAMTRANRLLTSEENWREVVLEEIEQSRIVLLVPEDRPGTSWETEQILSQKSALNKTVFVNLASAGRAAPFYGKDASTLKNESGEYFWELILKFCDEDLAQYLLNVEELPAEYDFKRNVVAFAVHKDELHLFYSLDFTDIGMWSFIVRSVVFLKWKDRFTSAKPEFILTNEGQFEVVYELDQAEGAS